MGSILFSATPQDSRDLGSNGEREDTEGKTSYGDCNWDGRADMGAISDFKGRYFRGGEDTFLDICIHNYIAEQKQNGRTTS